MTFEREAMASAAPELRWLEPEEEPSGGWDGHVPLWPLQRPTPANLDRLVGGKRLRVRIRCGHAFPMIEPQVYPQDLSLPGLAFGWTTWHVAPDGALCLLQEAVIWDPRCPAAELVPKISGWYLEYQLLTRGLISAMTERGIVADESLDVLIAEAGACA